MALATASGFCETSATIPDFGLGRIPCRAAAFTAIVRRQGATICPRRCRLAGVNQTDFGGMPRAARSIQSPPRIRQREIDEIWNDRQTAALAGG